MKLFSTSKRTFAKQSIHFGTSFNISFNSVNFKDLEELWPRISFDNKISMLSFLDISQLLAVTASAPKGV